jgi:hypothetical protein
MAGSQFSSSVEPAEDAIHRQESPLPAPVGWTLGASLTFDHAPYRTAKALYERVASVKG